ncbi:delta-class carbonic anhydrase [Salinivibrio sp. ES.052]|uniref:delta-class carbonic anhydrase n=1 Tax=Salinivibrio sp. ES.052 TaxID=1882823 RepID=UPI00092ADD91|nr:delta-class carbonic anhydrase [Salinivibrio sp. ES.052]SIN81771.1 hypothetical protein SAMN05444724_0677 [Salinivibrio sp. ES.052]
MNSSLSLATLALGVFVTYASLAASQSTDPLESQREALANATLDKGFGPQSPRNIDAIFGTNPQHFNYAPPAPKMNLCNIHFHKNAEHKGGEFTRFAGVGNGHGYHSGYLYTGTLSAQESASYDQPVCGSEYQRVQVGDTLELHYVYSTASVAPGPTLGACLSDATVNPQLRVEAQVLVVVNDQQANNFSQLTKVGQRNGRYQAIHLPDNSGQPVTYLGSTTGPGYNQKGSPYQVTWRVRPHVQKVDIASVQRWCQANVFNERHAHGVRNLVTNPALLSAQ